MVGFYITPKHIPKDLRPNIKRFKLFFFIPIAYIALLGIFIPTLIITHSEPPVLIALILPFHLFSLFCMFYLLYFTGKTIKLAETKQPVTFNDYAGEFFMIWFYPIGIWFLQPRINQLAAKSETEILDEINDSLSYLDEDI